MQTENASARQIWLIILALAAITTLAYGHLFTNDFTNFDDDVYLLNNLWVQKGLSLDSIRWAFSFDLKEGTYWQPLTWLTLMLNYDLFGLDPVGYHLINLFIHIINTSILFHVLNNITGKMWKSSFVAALFALHPLNVETVAWAVELKSVLSTLFWMLALWFYIHYVRKPAWQRYVLVFVSMGVGLMAKSMIVTLPCVLLLLDFWPLGRVKLPGQTTEANSGKLSLGRILFEKIPLFALSVTSVAVSVYSLKTDPLHASRTYLPPLYNRVSEALVSYVRYLVKLVWPTDLAVYYPPQLSYPEWQVVCSGIFLLTITVIACYLARRRPWFLMGWLWYLGVLFPVSGLMRAGLWPAMADRFTYLPFIGLFIIIAWMAPELSERIPHKKIVLAGAAGLVVALLASLTWTQTGYWKTGRTLFAHALKAAPDNFVARDNYGHGLFFQGRMEEAMEQYRIALRFRPDYAKAHFNLGAALDVQERIEEALAEYRKAVSLDPNYAPAHNNLGLRLSQNGKYEEAKAHFFAALRTRPNDPDILYNLGLVTVDQGNPDESIRFFAEAVRLKPDFIEARSHRGDVLMITGRYEEAIAEFEELLKYAPDNELAKRNLEMAKRRSSETK